MYFPKCTRIPHLSFASLFFVVMVSITLPYYLLLRPDSEVVFTQIIRFPPRGIYGPIWRCQYHTLASHQEKQSNRKTGGNYSICKFVALSPGSFTYPQRSNVIKCEYNLICTAMMFSRENIASVQLKIPPSYIFLYIRVAALPDKRNSTPTSVRIENIEKYWAPTE